MVRAEIGDAPHVEALGELELDVEVASSDLRDEARGGCLERRPLDVGHRGGSLDEDAGPRTAVGRDEGELVERDARQAAHLKAAKEAESKGPKPGLVSLASASATETSK